LIQTQARARNIDSKQRFPEAGTEKRRNGKACEQSPQLPDERIAKIATAGFRLDARLMYLSFFEAGGRFTRALLRRPRQDFKSSRRLGRRHECGGACRRLDRRRACRSGLLFTNDARVVAPENSIRPGFAR
jgi:hypothetical protein